MCPERLCRYNCTLILCKPEVRVLTLQGVANGSLTVGDAVLFVTLIQQLYAPLNYFVRGSYNLEA